MVSVSGPESPALDSGDSSRTRFAGGLIRLHATGSLAIEASMDYQSSTNAAETASIRNMPIQISGMLIPVKKTFAPYVLAGIGWYKHRVEALDSGKAVASRLLHRLRVSHRAGRAGEARQSRRDLRGLPVRLGRLRTASTASRGRSRSAVSSTAVGALLTSLADDNAKESSISRGGSMWTGGLTIYF